MRFPSKIGNSSLKDHYPLSGKLIKITSTVDINILDQTAQGVNPSLDLEYATGM